MGFYVIANALTRLLPHGLHYTIDRLQPSPPQQKRRGYRNMIYLFRCGVEYPQKVYTLVVCDESN